MVRRHKFDKDSFSLGFRALSGRLKLMVRRHKFNKDSSPLGTRIREDSIDVGAIGVALEPFSREAT